MRVVVAEGRCTSLDTRRQHQVHSVGIERSYEGDQPFKHSQLARYILVAHSRSQLHFCTCLTPNPNAAFSPLSSSNSCSALSSLPFHRVPSGYCALTESAILRTSPIKPSLHAFRVVRAFIDNGSCRLARRQFGLMAAEELPVLPDVEDVGIHVN